jgi:hypothetical protein
LTLSIWATAAAWDGSQAKGGPLLVLLSLAHHADQDGYAYPSLARLQAMTRMTRQGVVGALDKLYALGEVERVKKGGRIDGRQMANLYRIRLDVLRAGIVNDVAVNVVDGGSQRDTPSAVNDVDTKGQGTVIEQQATPVEQDRQREAGLVADLHQHFVSTCSPTQTGLTPSRERLYRKALAEHSIEVCQQALDGLVAYVARKGGKHDLSRVFNTRPGGSPLGEQIEWWASQATDTPGRSAFIPSETAAEIQAAKRDVQMAAAYPTNGTYAQKGHEAMEQLRKHGVTTTFEDYEAAPGVTAKRPVFTEAS